MLRVRLGGFTYRYPRDWVGADQMAIELSVEGNDTTEGRATGEKGLLGLAVSMTLSET